MPEGDYPHRVSELAAEIRGARPAGTEQVRMPFDRSAAERARRMVEDVIEVPERVYESLLAMARGSA